MSNKDYKKAQWKADEGLEPRKNRHGKQPHQKMKGEHSNIGVIMFAIGFTVMMAMDVSLG